MSTLSAVSEASARGFLRDIWLAAKGEPHHLEQVQLIGSGSLPSIFAVTDLAVGAIAAAGLAVAELIEAAGSDAADVQADRRLASFWFGTSLRPQGWEAPALWDAVAGDYQAADGWIRLHTNAPHHRAAALTVLDATVDRAAVAAAVAGWSAQELETAVVAQGGCAAAMRTMDQWRVHPQGAAVSSEPLLHIAEGPAAPQPDWRVGKQRPLQGIRVLDLTRVLAGPTATRFMAGFGADVLRIDPASWDEPGVVPDMVPGKRCARLDLRSSLGQEIFTQLLAQADVLVHGYRSDALAGMGFDVENRRRINPALVDVSLDAYGWSGPWKTRRGFDSLVQMSSGIAEAGMRQLGRDKPTPLPVQALDHATGYLMATAAIRGLTQRLKSGKGVEVRTSLARMAQLLATGSGQQVDAVLAPENKDDLAPAIEQTFWGPAQRLRGAVTVGGAGGAAMAWDRPAAPLGSAQPAW
ncbi:CoA transferase [Herbaspirillum rhizosphaerae]|uniref:CoA transferase n=1 Tax=Herbaspirillum rhizosphaerae TaxID=346179 RepID=UPI00067E061E|nr:CoA transferase [Herbaspirillum rhizosphaerae]